MIKEELLDHDLNAKNETLAQYECKFALRSLALKTKDNLFDPVALVIAIQVTQDKLPSALLVGRDYTKPKGIVLYKGQGRIFVPNDNNLRMRVAGSKHNLVTAGHLGGEKVQKAIRKYYNWPNLNRSVDNFVDFVASCDNGSRNKARTHLPYGLHQLLDVPECPWLSISMETAVGTVQCNPCCRQPVDQDGPLHPDHNHVDVAGPPSLVLPPRILQARHIAKNIVSNWGSKFTSSFWKALNKTLGIEQRQSTAYHPQTNGQRERVNQVLEQYLRIFTNYNQDYWADRLPMVKFVYSSTLHLSTTMTPFFANFGYDPTITIALDEAVKTLFEANVKHLHLIHAHCRQEIQKAIATSKEYANRKRTIGSAFEIGFKLWLSTANLRLKSPMRKLAEKRLGPYKIVAKTS